MDRFMGQIKVTQEPTRSATFSKTFMLPLMGDTGTRLNTGPLMRNTAYGNWEIRVAGMESQIMEVGIGACPQGMFLNIGVKPGNSNFPINSLSVTGLTDLGAPLGTISTICPMFGIYIVYFAIVAGLEMLQLDVEVQVPGERVSMVVA